MRKPSKTGLIICAVVSGFFAIALIAFVNQALSYLPKVSTGTALASYHTCQYKGCGAQSSGYASLNFAGPESRFRESESYSINGHSYDKTETGYVPKKDTYLVATDKGLKVETERTWEEKTYVTGHGTYTTVEGYYCAEHKDAEIRLLENELKRATFASPGYYFLAVMAVLPWALLLWSMFPKKKKPGQPDETAKPDASKP